MNRSSRTFRAAGARIRLIGDGDLSAAISAALVGSGIHAAMGIGGAPEGVLAAAAMRCLNGEIFGRLVIDTPEKEARASAMGISDFPKGLSRSRPGVGRPDYLCGDRRHGRHLHEGGALLWRGVPHELAGDADRPP